MAFSLNRAQIIGNLTRDPEVRAAGTQKVATFGVATSFQWTDQTTRQKKEKTEFHNCVAWRKLAEICEQYLRKGSKVYIEGRLQTRDWEGEDGVKRYRTEVVVENMIMLDRKGAPVSAPVGVGDDEIQPPESGGSSFSAPREQRAVRREPSFAAEAQGQEEEVKIDDLPF